MEAVETTGLFSCSCAVEVMCACVHGGSHTSALELGGELPFQTLPHLPLSIQLHLQLSLLCLDLFVLHTGIFHGHLQQALKQTPS